MLNLFIKTDYWTRAQKPQVTSHVNLFCEAGKPGQATNSCLIEWSRTHAGRSITAVTLLVMSGTDGLRRLSVVAVSHAHWTWFCRGED